MKKYFKYIFFIFSFLAVGTNIFLLIETKYEYINTLLYCFIILNIILNIFTLIVIFFKAKKIKLDNIDLIPIIIFIIIVILLAISGNYILYKTKYLVSTYYIVLCNIPWLLVNIYYLFRFLSKRRK